MHCNKHIPVSVKRKFYKTVDLEWPCWGLNQAQGKKLQVVEMRLLCLEAVVTLLDKMANKYIRGSLGIRDIGYNIEGKRIRCLGHIVRRGKDHIIKKIREFKVR